MKNKVLSKILGWRKPYKLGLVLSGGGARGYAHLGVLKALKEHDLRPDIISGVSAGAIVGAFYCSRFSPDDIFSLMHEKGILRYSKFQVPRSGLLTLPGLRKVIEENLETTDLSELPIPLVIAATNFNKGKIEYFQKGNLSNLVLASSFIPVLFSPVSIGNYQYVDGGLYDNLPATPLLGQCQRIIGVNANPIDEDYEFKNLIQVAVRTFHLSVNATVQRSKDKVDLLIEPEQLAEYEILDSGKAREMFDIGYESAKRVLKGFQ